MKQSVQESILAINIYKCGLLDREKLIHNYCLAILFYIGLCDETEQDSIDQMDDPDNL